MDDNSTVSIELSFSTVLFLVFLVLKLTNVISWSWWWVTAPLWIGFRLPLVGMLILIIWYVIAKLTDWWEERH